MPGTVESVSWTNMEGALLNDVGNDGIYQNFSTKNSAYVEVALPDASVDTRPVTKPSILDALIPTDDTESTDEPSLNEVQHEDITTPETIEVAPDITIPYVEQTDPLPEENIPSPADDEGSSPEEPAAYDSLRDGVFGFFKTVSGLFPFADESITTPIETVTDVPAHEAQPTGDTEATGNPTPALAEPLGDGMLESTHPDLITGESGPTEPMSDGQETTETPAVTHDSISDVPHPSPANVGDLLSVTPELLPGEYAIEFGDFAIPPLSSGQFIMNAQLRMSFGATAELEASATPSLLDVEYSFGDTWMNAGTIIIDGEVSNALNGGYFLFALPTIKHVEALKKLQVRAVMRGDLGNVEGVFLDGLWIEVHTETFDRELLRARLLPESLGFLTLPKFASLLSDTLDFSRDDSPSFTLRYESQRNPAIRFLRSIFSDKLVDLPSIEIIRKDVGPVDVTPQIDLTDEGLITIRLHDSDREKLQPGTYTIELTFDEGGKLFKDSLEFQWGVLALNPAQTEYEVGDTAQISFAALSPDGNTLCDANLELYIIDPNDFISRAQVSPSGLCSGNNVIDRPDYRAEFKVDTPGVYEMYVEHIGQNGVVLSHMNDTVIVRPVHSLWVERNGPTRIYPPSPYPMKLTVTSRDAFSGTLTERVPKDFTVTDTDAEITEMGGEQLLTWAFDLIPGEPKTFSYSFDAPDISPYLYTLGPAEVENKLASVAIRTRTAKGATELMLESISEDVTNALEENIVPTPSGEAESDPRAAPTEEQGSGGTEGEGAVAGTDKAQVPDAGSAQIDQLGTQGQTPAEPALPETPGTEAVSTTSSAGVFVEHRRWQIASDATGSMIVLWADGASVPAGWTCISCLGTDIFYNKFPKGDAIFGSQGGATTSTHTVSAAVNATALATSENRNGNKVSIVSHSHTLTPSVASTTTLPAYRQLRFIQNNSAGIPATIPAGAILIFDGTLPSGWSQYIPLDDRYPMGQNTIVSSSTNTHIHAISGTTGAASGVQLDGRGGGTQASPLPSTENHTHTFSTSTPPQNHEPPYIQVVFATSSVATPTPIGAVAMWSDTPPAGWVNRSAVSGDPFYGRYIKGGAGYGSTGGSDTHTHSNFSASTSVASASNAGQTGVTGASNQHRHLVDLSDFSSGSNNPPYTTVIFARYYGLVPVYTQTAFRWYANSTTTTPTDPWPLGGDDVGENEVIDTSLQPLKNADKIRLRIQLGVTNSTSTSEDFKLQYSTTTSLCSDITYWVDVGAPTSSEAWIGYNNSGISDGVTLSSSTLTGTDKLESYEEQNPTVVLPNEIGIDQEGEWDFVLQQNNALPATNYCFRMVESDGTELFEYTQYPMLITNESPNAPSLSKLFDNEKTSSTTPWFEFVGTDPESNDLTYQVQIDDDYTFTSINIDRDTASHPTQFSNLVTQSDKDPYYQGETIRLIPNTSLTNGTTYYWRVRSMDPTGSNNWGDWSTTYSFTVDTAVTVSTWFQTTEAQFDTDSLIGTDAVATNLVQLASGSTTGTTTSSQIDFLSGSIGNAWGEFAWTDNETVGDIKYRLQYYNDSTASWSFIPDSVLSGNGTGFDTSPVSLLALDVETYRIIRLVAVFTNSGGSPTLSDWTISWGYRIDTPTMNAPFPNEKVGTTTPTFEFTTTDPQNDSLEYEIQWSTSYDFTSSTTRNSGLHSGFVDITDILDLSPFGSGHTIQFTIAPADALTNGTTYWWRVRARDPLGSNQYSFYTDPESLTVDTSVTVSTWFQTTQSQFDTDILSGTFARTGDTVSVATTSEETLVAYAEGTVSTPRYRLWDGSAWGAEDSALDVGAAITWVVTRAAPSENEYILATMGTDADVNVQVYANGSWGDLQEVTTAIANTSMRGFDVAYEQSSGDAMVVTCDGDANPTFYTWNGASWTNGGAVGITSVNTCGWVKLISDPVSDEIIVVTRDTGGNSYEARVWSGSAWGNSVTWGSMQALQANHEGIAAEYEESGNQAVVAVSDGTNARMTWRSWNGTVWSGATNQGIGDDFEAGTLVRDKGSDNMALCYVDEDADIGVLRWTGAAWVASVELDTAWLPAGGIYNDRPIDCVFEVNGSRDGYVMAVYSTTTGMAYRAWDGAAWSTAAVVSTVNPGPRVQVRRTGDDLIQALSYASTTDRYDYAYWNGSSWSASQVIETDGAAGATPFKEPFMIAPKNSVTVGTVVGDPGIDFYAGSGPYWQQMSWTDTESGGSSILYQVEYYDGDSWELVPDALIPGNTIGTSTSPIDLTGLLPVSTYSMLRPVANLSCNAGICPVLSDWTITWSEGITISGIAQAYDQSTNVTSGNVAVAVNGVLQTGKTGTISGGTWSIANVNVWPGDIVTVFVNGANETNEAIAVARYDGVGNMTGLRLYEQHLALGSDDATSTPFSNANIGSYDYSNDEDVFFDGSGTSLDMCVETTCSNSELYIRASTTYTPGGFTDLTNLENNGTFNMGSNTVYVGRSWDNNGTTTSGTSNVYFTATSTSESIDETGALSPSFYNLSFGTTTSTATWTLVTALDVNGNLSVTQGTLSRGTLPITVAGSLANGASGYWQGVGTTTFDGSVASSWSDANAVLQNVGNVVIDGTSKSVTLSGNVKAQSLTIGADDIFDASITGYAITVLSNWVNGNTFVPRTGTVYFAATSTNRVITAGGDPFYNLNFTGPDGSWSFTEADLSVTNDLTIATGTVTLPTGTTTITGSFTNSGGTFVHNNATVLMNASSAKTLTLSGTAFTNAFYNLRFTGSGSWSFTEANATTSNDFYVTQGTVTLPSGTLSVGGNFINSAGTFAHNSGTVRFTASAARTIDTNASFNSLAFTGSGSWSFIDSLVTALGNLTVSNGAVTLPSSTFTLGGSLTNTATLTHNNGTILFNSADAGETINTGNSSLYNATFGSMTGGWTIVEHATATNNVTLATSSSFTLTAGKRLAVGGIFTNSVGGASTTWAGSVLSLESGAYSMNTKTSSGDAYGTIQVKPNTDIKMWNSSADAYAVDGTGSLYSQDHGGQDGDLYIFGNYERTSGTEYWSYGTDFDGTALVASTSRQVDVRFESGGSAIFSGSILSIVGSSTATTSVANQGGGTYTIAVSNGTTTASHYEFIDLGLNGITLSGTTKVTSLSDGRFVPSVAFGAGLTVSSATIDANPGLQIYRVEFSTTTAIYATNTAQTDGTPTSYWWFRESSGNIDGEYFDNDTGDPGSVRWDDSSLMITVAGTVYDEDETTPLAGPTCGTGNPVRVVVEGGGVYDGACDGNGDFSIPNVVVVGDPTLTVFLNDAAGGERAVTVTKTPTDDIFDLDLIINRVIVRHEDTAAMTIVDMTAYDSSDDDDIVFTAATGTPNVLSVHANNELHVWATTTFTPDGTVSILGGGTGNTFDGSLHIGNAATFTGAGTTTYAIGGSFTMDSGATFIPASSTVTMNATTSGKTISVVSGDTASFNDLEFAGIGGAWNLSGNMSATGDVYVATGTVTGTGNVTLTGGAFYGNGLVSLGSGTTTIETTNTLGGTQGWTFANLVLGDASVVGTTTPGSNATTTIIGKLTIATGHYLDAGSSVWDLQGSGTVFAENGTFLEDASTVRYSGTSGSNVLSTNYYNLRIGALGGSPTYIGTGLGIVVLGDLTVGGTGTSTLSLLTNDPALDVNGNVTIAGNGTFIASDLAVFTVGGSWDNNGTFTGSGGTVTFDSSGTKTIAAGNSSFSSMVVNGPGDFTIIEHATATGAFTITSANDITVQNSVSLAVGGTFQNNLGGADTVWTGSTLHLYGSGNYTINASTTSDTYETLVVNGSTQVRMWNSSVTSLSIGSTASVYSMDNAGVNGDLFIYGTYTKTSGTDYWSHAIDFDGTNLAGGNERKVDVSFRDGSSAVFTGGGLHVVGTSTNPTTMQNQSTGEYGLRIGGTASVTMQYYEVYHTNASGLAFSGTPTISTLSHGSYIVTAASGTAITVGGTVISQNPAKTFTDNSFATTTNIIARNVTATGTSISSWRFTNHSGNIAGEDFDVDPDGDPGYIVWDDSAASISVSGNVFSDEGSSVSSVCDGSTPNIHLRVAGLTSYTTECDAGTGAYSISGISYSPGDSLVVYIDGETERAATVSEDPVSNISSFDLYENRIIVRHEGVDPLSIVDMAVWDSSDDADIPFTAIDGSPDTLSIPANHKLIVWGSKQFRPGGNVTVSGGGGGAAYDGTLELFANAVFDATGSETHTVGGSLISNAGASIDDETSTFTFTTPGAARTIDTNEYSLYNLVLSGSGSWTVTNSALEVGNDLTITQGSLTLPTGTTTVSGSFSNTGGTFLQNGGHVLFNSSGAETIRQGGSNFGTTTFNGGGSWTYQDTNATSTGNFTIISGTVSAATGTITIGGNFTNGGTFTHNNGTLRFTSSAASTTVTAGGSDLGSVTFAGSGAYLFTDTNVALAGTLRILSGTTTLASGTVSIGGSFLNTGGAFDHASGTVLFNSSDVGESINPGTSPFNVVSVAAPTGGYTVSGSATTTGNFSLTSAASFTVSPGITLNVEGVFTNIVGGVNTTWTGSTLRLDAGIPYTINTKLVGGDVYNILLIDGDTDIRMWNSGATTTIADTLSSLYSMDNLNVNGELYIYGNYERSTGTDYWSYATDFDGISIIGSERIVTVRIAGGATTTFTGGSLDVVGGTGATTTVTNQGSGTYAMRVSDTTFNAFNYAFRNLNSDGLQLLGSTPITSLSNGDLELAVSNGSLITVSSTTINYNASMVFSGLRFATTSAITGTNIAVVGSTPSAWTFTDHRGNLDGEYFDDDGVDDCGSIRWDDSTCLLTQQSTYRWRNDDGGEGVPDSEWFDTNWAKRKRVTITNADATPYTNAVVELTIPYDADMQGDFDDLRFTDASGTTTIDFVREVYTASTEATVWVEVPLLPATADTDIYMYYGNGGAINGGVGTTTFIAYDDFEDNNITEYSNDTALFTTGVGFAYQGSYGLEATDPNDVTTHGIHRFDTVVSQGETIRFFQYIETSGAGSGDETCTLFGAESPGTTHKNYAVCLEQYGVDRVSIAKNAFSRDVDATVLASTTISYSTGWYEVEILWGTDDSINVSVYRDGSLVATTSATDSEYTTGGIGFSFWGQHGGWDLYSSRPLLTTEPTTTIGFEQVRGGASWRAALNTAASGVGVGDTVRVRFVIENTGLTVSDAYRLEYAVKGVAPSCESVASGLYADVPAQASCAGSPLCMQSSTQFVNQASTTDVLGGTGVFTEGQIIEDPSNTTQSISLESDEFTEVEYALGVTVDAEDSSYCLRVSDAGVDLDSYTRVAELGLIFAPDITALSLNGGIDITLSPGATTTVYATGTVSDQNGYSDLILATTTMFRSGVTEMCVPDTNNCYVAGPSRCSFTNCSDNTCDVVCSQDFYYHADPTDVGDFGGQTWRAFLSVEDQGGTVATATAPSIDLLTMRAVSSDELVDYGSLEINSDTGPRNATTTLENIGNANVDVSVEGTDLTDGGSSVIPVNEQIFATSTFTYSACTYCSQLLTTSTNYELDLLKPTTTISSVVDQLYWGIAIPYGVAGAPHQGDITFYPIND